MTSKDKPSYVLYIGTTKIVFLKAHKGADGKFEVDTLGARLSDGFERGIVKDLAQASETVRNAVSEVLGNEKAIISCRVVISNTYLKSYTFQSSVYFQGSSHPITMKDVRAAIAQTRSVANIPLQEVIVQAVPQEFLVNDLEGVQNPLGLEASRIGVTLRLLTLDFLVYNNLLRVLERCDLEVMDFVPGFLAASQCVLTQQEKQTGVILVLIGGGATHFACYKNSVLVDIGSILIGSDCITEMIAKNLNIEYLDAQKLKESFGTAVPKSEFKDELIPVPNHEGRKKYPIKRFEFESQMSSGVNLFFDQIRKHISEFQKRHAPVNQIVFTGGGVRLDGFLDVVKDSISPMSRIGLIQNIQVPEAVRADPSFVPALSGLVFSSRISEQDLIHGARQNWVSRTIESARNWIFEYL